MFFTYKKNERFLPIAEHVEQSYGDLFGSGAAVFAIHNDAIVLHTNGNICPKSSRSRSRYAV